ncbi:group III truncated hemoglobin [Flavobacterium undicola]|uniref:group III truncated hemoglobin n=1 Tax=Flavobacterium undicola TaxID=1932779 RepID=UPI001378DC30|nr:group III truncated hemoglobin [Flavobacterium undicola]MBA0882562.1 group III truncated hemoglobin [Flavobacterium undicola]
MKNDIKNRADVAVLVHSFYDKIRADAAIGSYFNELILDWNAHLEKLTDFWETNLFTVRKYKGNPIEVHNKVDEHFDGQINANEFGIWLNYWFQTLDSLFEGENVEILKRRARKMGSFLYLNMFKNRVKEICRNTD